MFEEVRPEMRALIYLMIGLSFLAIGLIIGQRAFLNDFLTLP